MGAQGAEIRQKLQVAEHLYQCGDPARAARLYLEIATAYARAQRTQEALAICHRAFHVDVTAFTDAACGAVLRAIGQPSAELAGWAAEHHLAGSRGGEATRMAELAADLDGRDPIRLIRVAEILLSRHMYPQAIDALFDAGARLLSDGNNADYIAVAEQILSIDAYHVPTLRELARTHLRIGEPHLAVERLATLHKAAPEDPAGYEILAHAFASIGRVPKALSILTRLVHDYRRDERADDATNLLDRAKWWRHGDEPYQRALVALRNAPTPPLNPPAAPAPREATVMLSIEDIVVEEERDLEGTLILAISDLAFVEATRRGRVTPPKAPPARAGRKSPPPPPAPNTTSATRRRGILPVSAATRHETRILDLADLEFEAEDFEDDPVTLPELSFDEEPGPLTDPGISDDADTAVRRKPVPTPIPRRSSPPPLRPGSAKAPVRKTPPPPPPPRKPGHGRK